MKYITSKDNAIYKQLSKVAQGRRKNEALLEGVHLCQMYKNYGSQLQAVILQEGHDYSGHMWQELLGDIFSSGGGSSMPIPIYQLSPTLFKQLNSVESPQPILFWIRIEVPEQLPMPDATTIYLDCIQDPGNLGTILRTCAAVGIKSVYLSKGCVSPWLPKVLRSGQGAHFVLDIYTQVDTIQFLQQNTLPVYITCLDSQATNLYQTQLPKEMVWVMGNEGQGVSDIFFQYPHHTIFIPQSDKVESLNVGIACGLVLYEQWRQQGIAY